LPNLGLEPQITDQLAQEVTEIIHCASDVRFGNALEDARRVNLSGVVNLMDLISTWQHVKKIAHISTVQVAGQRTGVIYENELLHACGFANSYEQSKYEAEIYLNSLNDKLPIAIYRVSGVVGDSGSGYVRQFNWLHQLLRLFSKNMLPVLPGNPHSKVDLVPVDWLTEVLLHIISERFEPGMTYHVAAGEHNALTIREMVEFTHRCLVQSTYARRRDIRLPKIVSREEYDRLLDQDGNPGEHPQARLLHTLMGDFIPQWYLPKTFDRTHLRSALVGANIPTPDIRNFYPNIIDYCLRSNWGRVNPEPLEIQQKK
jgi:thioester reductase-like protein